MTRLDSTALAMMQQRCPRCHEGQLFSYSALNPVRFAEMPEHCPVCAQAYEPEPGFYWGAMFISYAFSTAIMLATGVLVYYLLHDPAVWVYVTSVAVMATLLTPLSLRYSRTLMLYWFGGISYTPRKLKPC